MVSNEIFIGAGSSVTLIPETKFYMGGPLGFSYGLASENKDNLVWVTVVTGTSENIFWHYNLVPDAYIGCVLKVYDGSTALTTYHNIVSNDVDGFYLNGKPSDFAATLSTHADSYMEIQGIGAPAPAPVTSVSEAITSLATDHTRIEALADYAKVQVGSYVFSDSPRTTIVGKVLSTEAAGGGRAYLREAAQLQNTAGTNLDCSQATTTFTFQEDASTTAASVTGVLKAGDYISITGYTSTVPQILRIADDGETATAQASATIAEGNVYRGHDSLAAGAVSTISYQEGRRLLADNWLGLVNTVTPPNVEVEMKQLNLALSGTRNFAFQYKGAETISGGSMDLSVNNPQWLYYALGKISSLTANGTLGSVVAGEAWRSTESNHANGDILFVDDPNADDIGGPFFHKVYNNKVIAPPVALSDGVVIGDVKEYDTVDSTTEFATKKLDYTFAEANGERLPTFALEVTNEKGSVTSSTFAVDTNNPNENIHTRIFTGNMLNSLTFSFEEGQELKMSLDFLGLRAIDAPNYYVPLNYETTNNETRTSSNLHNFNAIDDFNKPFFYFDGTLKVFGQEYGRIKTGSLTITNNVAAHRFIGNYNREKTSVNIPAQRTYEMTFTVLVTDTQIWDELRSSTEKGGSADSEEIQLLFRKDTGEEIKLLLRDYYVTGSTIPIPEDKGPIEVEMTIMARNMEAATASTTWITQG